MSVGVSDGILRVRPSDSETIRDIARLHQGEIFGGIADLPLPALEAVYRSLASDNGSILLAEFREARFAGFVFGSLDDRRALRGAVRANIIRLLGAVGLLALKPWVVYRLLRTALSMRNLTGLARPDEAHLVSIAVSPNSRRVGTASRLLAALEQWFRGEGVSEYLVMTNLDNVVAANFYKKSGGAECGVVKHFPRHQILFRKQLSVRTADAAPNQKATV